jgi:hypothetical protein
VANGTTASIILFVIMYDTSIVLKTFRMLEQAVSDRYQPILSLASCAVNICTGHRERHCALTSCQARQVLHSIKCFDHRQAHFAQHSSYCLIVGPSQESSPPDSQAVNTSMVAQHTRSKVKQSLPYLVCMMHLVTLVRLHRVLLGTRDAGMAQDRRDQQGDATAGVRPARLYSAAFPYVQPVPHMVRCQRLNVSCLQWSCRTSGHLPQSIHLSLCG